MISRLIPVWIAAFASATTAAFPQAIAPHLTAQSSGTTARLVALSVVSPTIVWGSGAKGTYVRSVDGGATWQAGTIPGGDSLTLSDIHAVSPEEAVVLSAGQGHRARIYRTTDGGATWTPVFQNQDSSAFYDCMAFNGRVGVAVGDALRGSFPLLRTTDGGRTWSHYAPPGYSSVNALDGEGAAAFGSCVQIRNDGAVVFGTTKGGRVIRVWPDHSTVTPTPIVQGDALSGILTIAFRDDRTGVAAGGDLSKRDSTATDDVIVTRDGGATWSLAARTPFPAVFSLAYVPGHGGLIVGVSARGSAWSPDDGSTWRQLDAGDYWCVRFGPDGTGWMVGPNGRITKVEFR
jgi:photosystem II stability/assembly factor-like uncharacterized protein